MKVSENKAYFREENLSAEKNVYLLHYVFWALTDVYDSKLPNYRIQMEMCIIIIIKYKSTFAIDSY